jgi:hypothetical protein
MKQKDATMRKFPLLIFLGLILSACAPQGTVPMPQPTIPPSQSNDQPTASLPGTSLPPATIPPQPANQPYAPQPGDNALTRQQVFLDTTSVRNLDSDPNTYVLDMRGYLPTPCNKLRVVVAAPNGQNQVMVDVYSVINPDEICIMIVQPLDTSVMLGKFPSGHYTVWINGQQVGEFVEQ